MNEEARQSLEAIESFLNRRLAGGNTFRSSRQLRVMRITMIARHELAALSARLEAQYAHYLACDDKEAAHAASGAAYIIGKLGDVIEAWPDSDEAEAETTD